jgi:hypothetical protein
MKTMLDAIRDGHPWLLVSRRPEWALEPDVDEEERLRDIEDALTDAEIDAWKDEQ